MIAFVNWKPQIHLRAPTVVVTVKPFVYMGEDTRSGIGYSQYFWQTIDSIGKFKYSNSKYSKTSFTYYKTTVNVEEGPFLKKVHCTVWDNLPLASNSWWRFTSLPDRHNKKLNSAEIVTIGKGAQRRAIQLTPINKT